MSSEHDFEPIRGLPGDLPQGERLLWQGAPQWWSLAQRAFHMRSVGIYFAVLMAWRGGAAMLGGANALTALQAASQLIPVAIAALALLSGLALLTARTTVYTITSKRIVMRFGVALPKAINIPFTIVENAALKSYGDRSGDMAVTLTAPNKVAYFLLWPHARPWKFARPEPTLRAVPNAAIASAKLASALKAAQAERGLVVATPQATETPVATPVAAMSAA